MWVRVRVRLGLSRDRLCCVVLCCVVLCCVVDHVACCLLTTSLPRWLPRWLLVAGPNPRSPSYPSRQQRRRSPRRRRHRTSRTKTRCARASARVQESDFCAQARIYQPREPPRTTRAPQLMRCFVSTSMASSRKATRSSDAIPMCRRGVQCPQHPCTRSRIISRLRHRRVPHPMACLF